MNYGFLVDRGATTIAGFKLDGANFTASSPSQSLIFVGYNASNAAVTATIYGDHTGTIQTTSLAVNGGLQVGSSNAGGDLYLARVDQEQGYILRPNATGFKTIEMATVGGGTLDNVIINANSVPVTGTLQAQQ
jgi:hypothetical protein